MAHSFGRWVISQDMFKTKDHLKNMVAHWQHMFGSVWGSTRVPVVDPIWIDFWDFVYM